MTGEVVSTEAMAAWVAGTEWSAVPQDVQLRTKLLLADTVGVMIAGFSSSAAQIAAATFAGTPDSAAALFRVGRAAAYGVAASALDFDDGHIPGGGIHPSGVVVPALLAFSSKRKVGGCDFLAAQLAAYEMAVRAARILYPRHANDRYHTTGTAGSIGAAAGAARLERADPELVRRALEIASAFAPLATFQLPMVKESMGWGAATAVSAAELAVSGFKQAANGESVRPGPVGWGYPSPFDEPFAAQDSFVSDRSYAILAGYMKPYACCRYIHSAADALIELLERHDLADDDISEVVVGLHEAALELSDPEPQTLEMAQYSFPFVLGSILTRGDAGAAEISEQRLRDSAVLAAARKVRLEHEPELDPLHPARYPGQVTVVTRAGERWTERRITIHGEPEAPMAEEEIRVKLIKNAAPAVGEQTAGELWELCLGFEEVTVDDLARRIEEVLEACVQRPSRRRGRVRDGR